MQYDVNNGLLQVVIEGEEINAVVGEAAQIDVGEAINYIQTGTAEIEQAVEEGITQFNENATEKTNEFDLNAQNKTNNFNSNAVEKTNDFNSNAQDKTGDFNNNATDKTGDFNDNASDKTSDFNLNAQNKTSDFNDNYTEKKGLIDAQVAIAEGAATTATNQAGLAKQWAIGDPSEPVGNSSKYWAEYAESIAQSIGDPANKDLSNLSTTGNNRFVNLQQQIDAIVASSDVFDIVGTYAELQAYDITTVPVNDIVKVLVDSTHSGAATYYRCVESGGVKSWSYIGSEGAYYTKAEADAAFQATLVSGTNIKTINNNSILGSGNVNIDALPSQTGQSGKFLTTDGTDASWANVDALPSQTGQSGKFLTTNGTNASWANVPTRNIGEIVESTIPLTDAGLHLLDGSLISGSGSYSAFVTYIAGLVSSYPDLFETEANWQTSVTNYGVCGKFVYDSVNNTVRLPKRASEHGDLIKSYSSGSDWYRIYSDGWCEQGGSTGLLGANSYTRNTITFLKEFVDTNYTITTSANKYSTQNGNSQAYPPFIFTKNTATCVFGGYCWTDGFDWVASGFIDVSDLELSPIYEYIVIATSVKTNIEVDIDEIATDLNGKADTDFTNITNTAKVSIAHNAMPSDTYIDLTLDVSDTIYTAPADGWFTISKIAGSDWYTINMMILDTTGTNVLLAHSITGYRTAELKVSLPARKGQKCQIWYNASGALQYFRFVYAQGAESEA